MRIIRLKLQVPTTSLSLSLDCMASVKFSFFLVKGYTTSFFFTLVTIRLLG